MKIPKTYTALRLVVVAFLLFFTASCSYNTRKSYELNQQLSQGNITAAYKVVSENEKKWMRAKKDLVIYYLNRGTIAWMMGKNEESIKYLLKADYYFEDLNTNYSREALSYLINPRVKEYGGEDFEGIMISYYQILNFIQINNLEKARIQARRLSLQLNRVDDKYKDWQGKNKSVRLQHNAFAHSLMGLVYEMSGEYNTAFIAYRNSFNYYNDEYSQFFGINAPLQLKKDLLRTAHLAGMDTEVERYSKEFNLPFNPQTDANGGNLIFFWNNGLSPFKDQVSADFVLVPGQAGWYTFSSPNYGYSIPVFIGTDPNQSKGFNDIQFVRATFPTYLDRLPWYQNATLTTNGQTYGFELAENINATAHKTLKDRMLLEFGKTLARVAAKKVAEMQARKENKDAGAAIGVINYLTEQADTRCWYSLPHTIYYTRLSLPHGKQEVKLNLQGANNAIDTVTFKFDVQPGKTYVQPYQTIQSR